MDSPDLKVVHEFNKLSLLAFEKLFKTRSKE
jgi:hypothetical protein